MDNFVIRKNPKPNVSCVSINNNGVNTTTTTTTVTTTTTTTITRNNDNNNNVKPDLNINKEELQELLKNREKYLKHQESAKKAYKKYAVSSKGKEARRKAMRAFRQRAKEKEKEKEMDCYNWKKK